MPRPKYRAPPDKKTMTQLDSFTFGSTSRRKSVNSASSLYSPGGSRMPSRNNSVHKPTWAVREPNPAISRLIETADDGADVANVGGASRRHSKDGRVSHVHTRGNSIAKPHRDANQNAYDHQPFTVSDLSMALDRSTVFIQSHAMEKLKNMISPGHNDDDQKLYGTEGSTTNPTSTTTAPGSTNPATGNLSGHGSSVSQTPADPSSISGHMPGGFETPREESTRHLGAQSAATTAAQQPSGQTLGGTTSGAPVGQHASTVPEMSGRGYGSANPTTQTSTIGTRPATNEPIGSTHPSDFTRNAPGVTSGTSHPTGTSTLSNPAGSGSTHVPSSVGGTTGSASRLQDPAFSNRTLQPGHQAPTSGTATHQGRDTLTGAGVGAAGYEAARHSGHSGPGGHHGLANPTTTTSGPETGSMLNPTSGATSHSTVSNPVNTSSSHTPHGLTGSHHGGSATGTSSGLPDRSAPHADVGGTVTERSFPLGGHAGEGPHSISTANRLDPHVPDSAQEYRQGTHHHHDPTSSAAGTTGMPTSRSHEPYGSGANHPSGTSSHLGRDAALGTGAAGLGAAGAHEFEKNRTGHSTGSRGVGPNDPVLGSASGTGPVSGSGSGPAMTSGTEPSTISRNAPTMTSGIGHGSGSQNAPTSTSGGVGHPSGHKYNTLSDGTPSGIATSDPAHPMSSSTGQSTSSPSGTHGSSHLGRDAALGAGALGAGGLAAHEASQGSRGPGNSMVSGGAGEPTGHKYNTLGSGTPSGISSQDPALSSTVPGQHKTSDLGPTSHGGSHLGRDAAVGAGAAGLGGGAAYEASRHSGPHPSSGGTQHQPLSASAHPSRSDELSGRDTGAGLGGVTGGHGLPAGYKHEPPAAYSSTQPTSRTPGSASAYPPTSGTDPSGHHYGRDAGLVGAGAGAAGLGAHEYEKHHHPSAGTSSGLSQQPTSSVDRHAPVPGNHPPTAVPGSTSSSHPSGNAAQKAQESISNYPERDSHAGRDTAAVAGAGGLGAAGYEEEKHRRDKGHHDHKHDHRDSEEKKPGLVDKLLGRKSVDQKHDEDVDKQHDKELKKEQKQYEKELKEEKKHEKEAKKDGKHHKEEAAIAGGGAGAAGLAAAEHQRHGHDENRGSIPGTGTHGQQPYVSPSSGNMYPPGDGRVSSTTGEGLPSYGGSQAAAQRHGYGSTGDSHHGREVAGAGAGAAGAGYAAEKLGHHGSGSQPGGNSSNLMGSTSQQPSYGGTDHTPLPSGSGHHASAQPGSAALSGGYGGMPNTASGSTGTHYASTGAPAHSQTHATSDPTYAHGHPSTGRDAGLAGAGGAAYGGEKLAHPTSGTHSAVPTSTQSSGLDPRVDQPRYSGVAGQEPMSATDSAYAGSPTATKMSGSRLENDPVHVGDTPAAGTRNAPDYSGAGESPSSASGEKKGGLLNKLLHRDDPNKLSKDAGTSHHHSHGSGSGTGM
ncbi:MAG: hypothetical protein Q9162_002823 [Coniocarpon cinnabarinum]